MHPVLWSCAACIRDCAALLPAPIGVCMSWLCACICGLAPKETLRVLVPLGAPRRARLEACLSQLGLLRRGVRPASSYPQVGRSCRHSIAFCQVNLEARQDEAGKAINVLLLHAFQHGAPRREHVHKLSTNAGDRRALGRHLLIVPGRRSHFSCRGAAPGGLHR